MQQISTFVALCEGFLGVEPCLNLFKYFFKIQWEKCQKDPSDIGCTGFRLHGIYAAKYISSWIPSTNQGWHKKWFYLLNNTAKPFPEYTGDLITLPLAP